MVVRFSGWSLLPWRFGFLFPVVVDSGGYSLSLVRFFCIQTSWLVCLGVLHGVCGAFSVLVFCAMLYSVV